MKKIIISFLLVYLMAGCMGPADAKDPVRYRRIKVSEYVDKMKAGWIGQMAGVGWGAPTEFRWAGKIIPAEQMPAWTPEMINQYQQDDIYVEMTFLRTLEQYGLDVSIRQAGIDFANSGYPLWHANWNGRENLRKGIAPPDSSHPRFNIHADDIDYQIEADYAGLIAPGMPNQVIRLGETFGRLMNYGDGLYAGQFMGGMYAEAFFETDVQKIIEAGLKCIPAGSQYHECISDVLTWNKDDPNDWQETWNRIENKYNLNPDYRQASCVLKEDPNYWQKTEWRFNIDAKINGAYVVMGLLYGQGDPDQTIIIAARCGQDSDCNPSSAAGVLFTALGYSALPEKFTAALDLHTAFSHTPYTYPMLIDVCEKLARQTVTAAGGHIEKDAAGEEVFVIPVEKIRLSPRVQCWQPGPVAGSRFTAEEMAQITVPQ